MKSKLKFILPVVLIALLAGGYKFAFAKGTPPPKPKVDGQVYVLPKDFYINLRGGRFARLGVALVLAPEAVTAEAAHGEGSSGPPEGYGTLPQEALVRSIVTDVLTDESAARMARLPVRDKLRRKILKRIKRETDVEADEVVLTDVAVQ